MTPAIVQMVFSPVYVDALILRDRDTDSNGTLDERLWVQQDANFNVTALLDNSGAVVERYVYDPYGAATVLTPTWGTRTASLYGWVSLHQGGRFEAATGLYDFRHRALSPNLMRWTQLDPLRYSGGDTNLYRYLGNNAGHRLDPLELVWVPCDTWKLMSTAEQKAATTLGNPFNKDQPWMFVINTYSNLNPKNAPPLATMRTDTRKINLTINDEIGIKMLRGGRAAMWVSGEWMIDFTERYIWIQAKNNAEAAKRMGSVVTTLLKYVPDFDVDPITDQSTMTSLLNGPLWGAKMGVIANELKNMSIQDRQRVLMLLRMQAKVSANLVHILAKSNPLTKPGAASLLNLAKAILEVKGEGDKLAEIEKELNKLAK